MIETIEELGKVLRYRKTDETYDETINRYSKIISNWHETHTSMVYKLKQLVKSWDSRINTFNDQEEPFYDISLQDVIALQVQYRDELKKILVDIEVSE